MKKTKRITTMKIESINFQRNYFTDDFTCTIVCDNVNLKDFEEILRHARKL